MCPSLTLLAGSFVATCVDSVRLALEDEDVFLPQVDPFCDVISTSDAACCDDRPKEGLIGGIPSLYTGAIVFSSIAVAVY